MSEAKDNLVRLQKYMADAGVASRRKSEELITSGFVKVNGKVVTELGYKVGKNDIVEYKNKILENKEHIYYILNKPAGVLTSTFDKEGKKTVIDLIDTKERIYPIGRLNYNVSGAVILTNDGELANKLTKKSSSIPKIYHVRIKGLLTQTTFNKLYKGFKVGDNKYENLDVELVEVDNKAQSSLIKLTLSDSKNNDIYKIFEALGYEIKKIKRIEFAGISVEGLSTGEYRSLKIHEIKRLYSL